MEGVESVIFENLDSSISTKDDHCDTFVFKKPDEIVCIYTVCTNN